MKGKILLVLSLLFINHIHSQNLLSNPGFETGSSGVGFVCNGAGYTQLTAPFSGTTVTGNFAVVTNPNAINTANFIFAGDHTSGVGKMLVIDGNTTAGNPRFWKAGNTGAGVTTMVIGTTYRFSYWIKSVSNLGSPADISLQITGGTPPVLTLGATTAPTPAQGWRHVIYTFTATATTGTFELWNTNTAANGNDFAVDDFMLTDDLMVSPSVTNAACATAADGSITVTGVGGTPPYVNYQLTQTSGGSISLSNATGIFPNLPPGTYTVSVTDSALPTAATATMTNVIVGPRITVTSPATVCAGTAVTLNAAGSPSGYTWTASPADATLTTPNATSPTVTPAVTTTYTATSTVGSCAPISSSVVITVNPLPNVTSPSAVQTICPGNTATFTITGTPNSTVTLTNPSVIPLTTTVNIGPAGTGTFTTPILNASVIYTFIKIKGFFTGCERLLPSTLTLTINVVPNGCATVETDNAPNTPPLDLTLCTTGECRTLQANFSNVPSTTSYAVSSIPYCPQAAFNDPTYNQVNISIDDIWSSPITLPFNFCFFNTNYTTCQVGTNGVISFNNNAAPGFCPWSYSATVPSAGFPILNAIYGVYQDLNPAVAPTPPAVTSVNWKLTGTYPCRKLIVNFDSVAQFSCGNSVGLQTSQIVLYEVSNIVEVYVARRVPCTSWNSGNGVIGIQNAAGNLGYTPPGRNTGSWSATQEAWRFTPTGPNVPVTIDWYIGSPATGTHIGTGPTINVCPAATTTYTLQATYQVCGVPQTAFTTTTLNVHPDNTGTPNNLTQCAPSCSFDLTSNTPVILGALTPSDYDITYHTSLADADTAANPIVNPATYCPSGGAVGTYTVYASIFLNAYNCHIVKPFTLTIQNCGVIPSPVNDIVLCDDISNDGVAVFDLTPQVAAVLGGRNPADYTITFHTSLADATNDVGAISPINAYTNTSNPQTIWIRMESNINIGQFGTIDFDLILNIYANAGTDGNTTVCETSVAPIDLFGLITGEQTGGVWTQTSGTGGTFNAAAGTFTPAVGATTSTFTYTVHGVAPCVDDTSIATVNINPQPTAGSDGSIVICASSATPIDLFSLITGEQAGGSWIRNTGTGGVFNAALGTFAPTAGATSSTFTYTVNGTLPCINDSSVATVTITGQPDAGFDGNTIVCETSSTAINLSSIILGEQPGGVWTQTSGTGGTFNAAAGTFTPAVGATTSTFTYTLAGTAPCITDSSIATVNIIAQPTAGTDGGTVVCETSTVAVDLFSLITGEQAGGTWVRSTGTGGTFNAAAGTYTPAVGATTSTFTYTVTGTAPCVNDDSLATITINAQPNAGVDGGTVVCETSSAAINLFSLITGEQPGGVWTQTSGSGGTFNAAAGTYTPAVGATSSTFTYTLTGTAPCINDTSLATVTVNAQPNAGVDGGTVVCETSTAAISLFSLITGEQAGGVWTQTSGSGGTFNAAAGTYTPAVGATTSTFTYTLTGVAPCINDTSLATVTINAQPTAGTDGSVSICQSNATPINLFSLITGEQAGGTWVRTTGSGGVFNAAAGTFTSSAGATSSTFTYTVNGTAPCVNDDSVASVNISPLPTASISGTTAVCQNGPSPQIILTGSGGTQPYTFTYSINTVVQPSVTTTSGNSYIINAPTGTAGTFIYTLISVQEGSPLACSQPQSGSATVTVSVAPTINTPTDYVVCDDSLNNDGIYCGFNLTTKDAEVSTTPGVVITYHETLTDAQTGANPKPSPYCNLVNNQQIFVRAYNSGAPLCYSTTSFHLVVNPIPLPNPVITDYELCDYNAPTGQEVFNLGTKITEIANGQGGVSVTFYDSLLNAQNQTSPLPILYTNTSNPQQIWINIRNNATGCNTTGSFNLIVNPLPLAVTAPTLFECSNGVVLTATFDLTINESAVRGNVPGMTVSWYNTLADAQGAVSPIAAPATYTGSDNETVYIRVEDNVTGCYSTTTQLLRVTQGPVALTPQPLQYCDPNNDGFGVFNLNDADNEITGTPAGSPLPPGVSVSYHETQVDALIGANALVSPYANIDPWSQTVYVRVYYTLTGCANYTQLKLNVNPTPEATDPTPYELCDYNAPAGQENFDLTTKISEILGTINPALTTVTFHTTLSDAQNDTAAIVGVSAYPSPTATVYVRVETTATGCFDIVELDLIVNPLPNSLQPNYPKYSLCDNDQTNIGYETFDLASQINGILLGQSGMDVTFYASLSDAQNNNAPIGNLMYTNVQQYVQTLGIKITNRATGCYVISTMDIRVEPLPTPIPLTQPYTICDDNQDGFSCGFDLSSLQTNILQGANYTLYFYETLTDALTGNPVTAINATQPYCNIDPFVQTLYVRAVDNVTGCSSVMPIELNVDPSPIAPIALDDIAVCDYDTNTQDGQTFVDLTQRTADVLAQQPLAATSYTVTYYTSQANAQTPTGPIIQAAHYYGTNGQTIWVRVENNASQCFNIGSFLLEINAPLALTTPTPLSMCDDDATPNNQFHEFNLTVKNSQIAPAPNQIIYYPSLALAQAGAAGTEIGTPTAYTNTSAAVQTLGVVVMTPAGCKSITTLDIRVLPIPTPRTNPPALAPKCDDVNPGNMTELFDLTVNEGYIGNGDPNLTFHYFPTQADAENNNTAVEYIPANSAEVGHNVWIRVENNRVDYQGNHCYVVVEQALKVNPLPTVIQPLAPFRVCDDNADGIAVFNLADPALAPQILGTATTGQLPADYTISYYLTAANAASGTSPLPSNYTNVTPNSQNIYIRVVNNATGCVNATGVLTLAVEAYATATGPQAFTDCDNFADPYDGVHEIDLTQFESAILGGQNPAVFLVSYYRTQADAMAGINALTPAEAVAYHNQPDTDTIWVKVENSSNSITPFCYALTTINIDIERYPNPVINTPNNVNTICVDFLTDAVVRTLTLDAGMANPANYTYEWFEAGDPTTVIGTGATYTVDTPAVGGATRSYTVHVTSNSALGCDTVSASFDVIQSGQAVIPAGTTGYTVSNAFSNMQTITVDVVGYGTYEYSLDDGPRQASNMFENVALGPHVIHVWDTEGGVAYSCEELVIGGVQVIDYPHYFTPNGDGIHDTWNIVGLQDQPQARIYIFDRYGKLLKQISSKGQGWDGTYNGHLLPADDYWFTVDFAENSAFRTFRAHFTLKR